MPASHPWRPGHASSRFVVIICTSLSLSRLRSYSPGPEAYGSLPVTLVIQFGASLTRTLFLTQAEARAKTRLLLYFAVIACAAALGAGLLHADTVVYAFVESHTPRRAWRPVFEAYSRWGLFLLYLPFLAMLVAGFRKRNPLLKAFAWTYVLAQLLGSVLAVHAIKLAVDRPRPPVPDPMAGFFHFTSFGHALHSSFPSSHAVDTAVGAFLLYALLRSRTATSLALAVALLMAASRVLLGKHYLTDVLAGIALGTLIAAVALYVYLLPRWQRIESGKWG